LSIHGISFCQSIVYIRTEGMQWDSAFFILFCPSHIRTIQPARDPNLDSFRIRTHRRLNSHLDHPTVIHPCFQLPCNRFSNNICIQLRLPNLHNIDLDFFPCQILKLCPDTIHFTPSLSDDDTGTRSSYSNRNPLQSSFYNDRRYPAFLYPRSQIPSDSLIFYNLVRKIFIRKPVRIPAANDPQTITNRICLLSHSILFAY